MAQDCNRRLASRAVPIQGIVNPLVTEAMTTREALCLAVTLGYKAIEIGGDSLGLIKILREEDRMQQVIEVVIHDIRWWQMSFDVCSCLVS